ncbi:MAG TPA: Ran-binding zinc finger domain-containing protein [Acidimicrobiia bacterium]|nr:Ran-binding zinc finger domain-containing protein [Acidimicrobiia bacterium]
MTDPVVCSQCGARSPAAAEWCGQCFAPLGGHADDEQNSSSDSGRIDNPTAVQADVVGTALPISSGNGKRQDAAPGPKSGTWVCSLCEVSNPLDVEQCSACGTSIFRSFGATIEEQIMVDPQRALLRSLMFPGLGHAYAKQGLLGSAIGGLALMSLGFGVGLVATGVGSFGWPLILLTIGVWVVAALDAFRIADGQTTNAVLLRPRVVTALVGTVVVQLILAAFLEGRT